MMLCSALAACIDAPVAAGSAPVRLVASWDPLACGEPHRVVIELEDDGAAAQSASAPCNLGGLTLDLAHLGSYRGQIYAWALGQPIRSIAPIELAIDQPIVHWAVATPP
jgi:hypothetical protein